MDANTQTGAGKTRAPTLYIIAVCKLAKGVALLLLAVWIFSLSRQDLPDDFNRFLEWVRLDPEHSFFKNIAEWLATITPGNVRATALATFLYGIFLLIGGTGLAIRAKWAIWLTIGESAFFIPVEILELTRRHLSPDPSDEPHPQFFPHRKIGLLIILALNIIVVSYLWKNRGRLFRHPD